MKIINNRILGISLLALSISASANDDTIYASGCVVDNYGKWEYFYTTPTEDKCLISSVNFTSASLEHSDYSIEYTYDAEGRKTSLLKSSKSAGLLLSRTFTYDGELLSSMTETKYTDGTKNSLYIIKYDYDDRHNLISVSKYNEDSQQPVEVREYEYSADGSWYKEVITINPDLSTPEITTLKYVTIDKNIVYEYRYKGKSTDLNNLVAIRTMPSRGLSLVGNIDLTTGNLSQITGISYMKSDLQGEGMSFDNAVLPDCFFPTEDLLMNEDEQRIITSNAFISGNEPSVLQAMEFYTLESNPSLLWPGMELISPFILSTQDIDDNPYTKLSNVYRSLGHIELTFTAYMPAVSIKNTVCEGVQSFAAVCATGQLSLVGLDAGETVRITDLSGKIITTFVYDGTSVDLTALDKGVYIATSGANSSKFAR